RTKFVLNCFYQNDHESFSMHELSDRYKSEWIENAPWLKLSFHSFSEFPDRPYQDAPSEIIVKDYDLIRDEIVRFAGPETFYPPAVTHWGMVRPASFDVLVERGVKVLNGLFLNARSA